MVPPHAGDRLIGVWDADSPSIERFDDEDQTGMEALCRVLTQALYLQSPEMVV